MRVRNNDQRYKRVSSVTERSLSESSWDVKHTRTFQQLPLEAKAGAVTGLRTPGGVSWGLKLDTEWFYCMLHF